MFAVAPGYGSYGALAMVADDTAVDCWSMASLREELARAMTASQGASDVEAVDFQFGDYTVWQRECLANGNFSEGIKYWEAALKNARRPRFPLVAPEDVRDSSERFIRGGTAGIEIGGQMHAALRGAVARMRTSPYMMVLAALSMLVARLSGDERVVIESVAANRATGEQSAIIGPLHTPMFLSIDTSGSATETLAASRMAVLTAQEHIGAHPALVAAHPELSWIAEATPDFMVRLQYVPTVDRSSTTWEEPVEVEPDHVPADLQIVLQDVGDTIVGSLNIGSLLAVVLGADALAEELIRSLQWIIDAGTADPVS
jgi:hypothetical protein